MHIPHRISGFAMMVVLQLGLGLFIDFIFSFRLMSPVTPCELVVQPRSLLLEFHLIKFVPSVDGAQGPGNVMCAKTQPFFKRCSFTVVLYTIHPLPIFSMYIILLFFLFNSLPFPPFLLKCIAFVASDRYLIFFRAYWACVFSPFISIYH